MREESITFYESLNQSLGLEAVVVPAEPITAVIGGRYEVLDHLGAGGMGDVVRVYDRQLEREVAMKLLKAGAHASPAAVERFRAEVLATAQLQHPGIVPVLDAGALPDGRLWFTMPEVRGQTFTDVIAEAGPGGRRRLVETLRSVSEAVAYAHDKGVLHRDLKPDNVMIGPFGEVLVMDWGLVKIAHGADDELAWSVGRGRTLHGAVSGTLAYMPPEQARGDLDAIGPQSDVYALGAVLYEILSGRPPFRGASLEDRDQVIAAAPAAIEDGAGVPGELIDIQRRAMAPDPARRFPHAGALARALGDWLDGVQRREIALEHVQRALAVEADARTARVEGEALKAEADRALRALPRGAGSEQKARWWAVEDRSVALARRAARLRGGGGPPAERRPLPRALAA